MTLISSRYPSSLQNTLQAVIMHMTLLLWSAEVFLHLCYIPCTL